jgi:hypothetical protein
MEVKLHTFSITTTNWGEYDSPSRKQAIVTSEQESLVAVWKRWWRITNEKKEKWFDLKLITYVSQQLN